MFAYCQTSQECLFWMWLDCLQSPSSRISKTSTFKQMQANAEDIRTIMCPQKWGNYCTLQVHLWLQYEGKRYSYEGKWYSWKGGHSVSNAFASLRATLKGKESAPWPANAFLLWWASLRGGLVYGKANRGDKLVSLRKNVQSTICSYSFFLKSYLRNNIVT